MKFIYIERERVGRGPKGQSDFEQIYYENKIN